MIISLIIFIIVSAALVVAINRLCDITCDINKTNYKDKSTKRYAISSLAYAWILIGILVGGDILLVIHIMKTFMDIASVHA